MRLEDIDLKNDLIHIRPNPVRRLKNKTSERVLPLVGYARTAVLQAMSQADDEWLFLQYIKAGHCYATHASNALNQWLKKDFGGPNSTQLKAHLQRPPEGCGMPHGYDRSDRWVEISWWYRSLVWSGVWLQHLGKADDKSVYQYFNL